MSARELFINGKGARFTLLLPRRVRPFVPWSCMRDTTSLAISQALVFLANSRLYRIFNRVLSLTPLANVSLGTTLEQKQKHFFSLFFFVFFLLL